MSGVVFMPSRASVEAAGQDEAFARSCREAGLPVVLIERNLRGFARSLEYDLVAADDLDGGLRCTGHLLDQGRRRIAFVIGSPTSSHEGRLAGYLTALNRAGEGRAPLVLEQRGGLDSKAAYADLADRLLAHHVDGVVCYQDYTALGLILELMTRGVRVPRDVAITGFDDLPIGKAFSIGVTTYAFSPEALRPGPAADAGEAGGQGGAAGEGAHPRRADRPREQPGSVSPDGGEHDHRGVHELTALPGSSTKDRTIAMRRPGGHVMVSMRPQQAQAESHCTPAAMLPEPALEDIHDRPMMITRTRVFSLAGPAGARGAGRRGDGAMGGGPHGQAARRRLPGLLRPAGRGGSLAFDGRPIDLAIHPSGSSTRS